MLSSDYKFKNHNNNGETERKVKSQSLSWQEA